MLTVKVGDISLYYEVHGDGEALVLIMGHAAVRWGGSATFQSSPQSTVCSPSITGVPGEVISQTCHILYKCSPMIWPDFLMR